MVTTIYFWPFCVSFSCVVYSFCNYSFNKYLFFLFGCNYQDIVAHSVVITEVQDLKFVGAVLNFKLFSNNGSYSLGPLHGTSVTQFLDSPKLQVQSITVEWGFLRI